MAKIKVYWTKTAIRQRNYIFEYWNILNDNSNYSIKLLNKIKERTELLKSNPEFGVKTEYSETRTISLGHYSILYKITGLNIFITGFWDNRQHPKKLLKFLEK